MACLGRSILGESLQLLDTAWGQGTLVLYAASLGLYLWLLYTNKRGLGPSATACLIAGLAAHYLALFERSRALHSIPYNDLAGSMSLFAWLLALTYLGLETVHRQRSVGPFVMPFVLVFILVSASIPRGGSAPAEARGPLFALHVTGSTLAYAAFAISFVLSLIYLIQNRTLRARHPGSVFWRFPALETLERMSRSAVIVGVVALALGSALGFVWTGRIQGRVWSADAKEIVSFVILAAYFVYLWLGRTVGGRGARAAMLCVVNFILVLFSYTVVNFYLSRYHRYF